MELHPDIIAEHTALWIPEQKILCFADLHLGYEEELRKKGIMVPLGEFQYQRALIGKLMGKHKPKTVILNGDVKHSFGSISNTEWRHTRDLLEMISSHAQTIIIKGNHDTMLQPIASKHNIQVVAHYKADGVLFLHGDVIPEKEILEGISTVVIGHEHPAISLTNGVRSETYKCFLKLPWKTKTLIVQPSTFSLTHGTDVMNRTFISPFLENVSKAEVFIVGDNNVLPFGKLNKI